MTVAAPRVERPARGRSAEALDARLMAARLGGGGPCHVLDAKLDPGGRGFVLYRLGTELVLGLIERDGELRTYPFPLDPHLPSLATAFDARAMRTRLAGVLTDRGFERERVLSYRAWLVRYRPTRRCTIRVELGLASELYAAPVGRRVLFAKLYHTHAKAATAHAAHRTVAAAGQIPGVAFARPAGFAQDMNLVFQEPLSGRPLEHVLRAGETSASALAGAAVAAFHELPAAGARPRPIEPAVTRMRARADAVGRVEPSLGAAMATVADRLSHLLGRHADWGAAPCLVHGDCKPSQFLIGRSGVSFLDLDHCGVADPASDIGAYLAGVRGIEARPGLGTDARMQLIRARGEFVDAYAARRGGDGLLLRVRWYEAATLLRKAYRAFQRSPRSPLADALVAAADRRLDALSHPRRRP